MHILLYRPTYEGSPPTWRVQLALAEKGLDWEEVKIAYDNKPEAFLKVNPRGQVPALQAGDAVVFETNAILEFLDHAFPEPPLLPKDAAARATALTRINEASNYIMPVFMAVWRHRTSGGDRAGAAALIDGIRAELARWEAYLTEAGGAFFAGGALSLADLSVYPYLAGAIRGGLAMDPFPKLRAFHDAISARPSAQRTRPPTWREAPGELIFA